MNKEFIGCMAATVCCGALMFFSGCVSPEVSNSNQISPDSDPLQGGISSADIRTVASKMTPSILGMQEIAGSSEIVRIKIADFKNNSRFFIDRNLFMKRLVLELNRIGRGKVRFLNNNEKVQASRYSVLKDRQSAQIQQNLKIVASDIAKSPVTKVDKPVKVAVIPVLNTNLVNMNADSFTAMLRSEIFNAAAGKIQFLMPGHLDGADYYLTGQFIPETMKTEGIINLANYIEVIDARVKAGKSIHILAESSADNPAVSVTNVKHSKKVETTTIVPGNSRVALYESHLKNMLNDPQLRANPNVNKRLNIMLVDAKSKVSVFEKIIMLDRKFSDNSGAARYVISGEISGMHQRKNGIATDYLLISVQLIDVESNETVWEDAYEVKRQSTSGIVYR